MNLSVVTFMSNTEVVNKSLLSYVAMMQKEYTRIELIIYSDNTSIVPYLNNMHNVHVKVSPRVSKYRRILQSIHDAKYDNIQYVDNDINLNIDSSLDFVKNFCAQDTYDISWGIVEAASGVAGFVPSLIKIDKLLSHWLIRPCLWKFNMGISVPGQIFVIKKNRFINKLPNIDTKFDDLMLGMFVKEENLRPFCYNRLLGTETPSLSFNDLLRQRKRWAQGYAECLQFASGRMKCFVIVHGIAYHELWIIEYFFFIMLLYINPSVGALTISFYLFTISHFDIKNIGWAIMYSIIFPIIHVVWSFRVCKFLFK